MTGDREPQRDAAQAQRLHATVRGKVQGVGFRWFVERAARSLGLTGWVRNREDRSVELVAEGPPAVLDRLAAALHEGPPGASVDAVEQRRGEATGEFSRFADPLGVALRGLTQRLRTAASIRTRCVSCGSSTPLNVAVWPGPSVTVTSCPSTSSRPTSDGIAAPESRRSTVTV